MFPVHGKLMALLPPATAWMIDANTLITPEADIQDFIA
jgi:hypothetical protein